MCACGEVEGEKVILNELFEYQYGSKFMICEFCKKGELIEGTLEGVSFQPSCENKKLFSSGVYGIKSMVCPECGRLTNFCLNTETLTKIVKKK